MRGRRKQIISLLLAMMLVLCDLQIVANAEETSNGVPEGVVLNYHDTDPIDSSFAEDESFPAFYSDLPESYSASSNIPDYIEVDSKDDVVTSVKEQNPYGTCWAHAAISLAESSAIKNGAASTASNYNEYQLVHYAYGVAADSLNLFGGDYNSGSTGTQNLKEGGNNLISLCMFASWHGASNASESTYGASQIEDEIAAESVLGYSDAAHMENGYVLTMPDMSSNNYATDMNVIKMMIMEYGSVAISYYAEHSPTYYKGCYQYYNESHTTNHAVTVVGWDDSVSKDSFAIAAPGDGAWIVKNSWGDDWGAGGYFYLSYYDATIAQNAFAFDFASGDNYHNNYQYDGTGNYYGYVGGYYGQVVAANAFVADSNETLKAVGFFTRSINTDYEIQIYRRLEDGANPNTGSLVLTQTGSQTFVGYHTVELDAAIPIDAGERYAVVVTLKGDADDYMLFPADEWDDWGWVSFWPGAKAGESYVGADVSILEDINPRNTDDYYSGKNVRIKAFTNERTDGTDVKVNAISLNHISYEIEKGDSFALTATVTPSYASNPKVTWSSSNQSVATVDQFGNVAAVGRGTATITVTAKDGSGVSATCMVTVTEVLMKNLCIVADGEIVPYYSMASTGNSTQFYAAYSPSNVTNPKVTWSSSNTSVATVDENGVVTGVSRGLTVITATAKDGSGVSASCLVAVQTVFVDSISLLLNGQETDYISNAESGDVYDFDVKITPAETEMLGVTWTSSNTLVASVDQKGKVVILSAGDTVITASIMVDGFEYKAECYIEVPSELIPFKVQHYVMDVNGKYKLALTENKYFNPSTTSYYLYRDFVKAEYNDGQVLSFSQMMTDGYPVTMFYPNSDGTSVVQMYYDRWMTPVYLSVNIDDAGGGYIHSDAYYIGSQVNMSTEWIKELTCNGFGITGDLEIKSVAVTQGNVDVVFKNGAYSFVTPVNNGMIVIEFTLYQRIDYEVNHYVMNESGNYVLMQVEHLRGYAKDSYPCRNLVKSEYNSGATYFKTLTVNDSQIAGLDINTSIRLANDSVVKIYYDRDSAGKFASYDGYDFYKDENGNVTCKRQSDGASVVNEFKCDGTYTYYFQLDGTAMRDRLTYHPDGVHVIYFDEYGHEVFSNFANVKKTISGDAVDDYCFFDVFGYLYVDVVTYDQTGTKLYYANPYGVLERGHWFQFSQTVMCADGTPWNGAAGNFGYANADGTLMKDQYTYNWEGRLVYMQGNGVMMYVD